MIDTLEAAKVLPFPTNDGNRQAAGRGLTEVPWGSNLEKARHYHARLP